jgi:hypothetical protein
MVDHILKLIVLKKHFVEIMELFSNNLQFYSFTISDKQTVVILKKPFIYRSKAILQLLLYLFLRTFIYSNESVDYQINIFIKFVNSIDKSLYNTHVPLSLLCRSLVFLLIVNDSILHLILFK